MSTGAPRRKQGRAYVRPRHIPRSEPKQAALTGAATPYRKPRGSAPPRSRHSGPRQAAEHFGQGGWREPDRPRRSRLGYRLDDLQTGATADSQGHDHGGRALQVWHQVVDEADDLDVAALASLDVGLHAGADDRKLQVGATGDQLGQDLVDEIK